MNIKKKKTFIKNYIISTFKSIYYLFYERLRLKWERYKHNKEYKNGKLPLISVYCPTYNRGKILIKRAVKSVLAQTYKNFEFIIVGDCCIDDTADLISKIGDSRIRWYNIPKRGYRYPPSAESHWLAGPVIAANTALKMVRGKWIARIDDDDTWSEDHLEQLINKALKENYEFISALYEEKRFDKVKIIDGEPALSPYYTRKETPPNKYNPKIGGTSTWLYRSYLKFMKYNLDCWRKNWNRVNDIDLSLRMFKAGVKMGFLDKVLAYVYPRPGEETVGLEAYLQAEEKGLKTHL